MQLSPIITFRGFEAPPSVEEEIRERIRKLETYFDRIMACRVLVELVGRHHEAGNRYHVRIDLTVPGREIVVKHEPSLHATAQAVESEKIARHSEPDPERKHEWVAIREAFDIARRQLQDHVRRLGGSVKSPVRQPRGHVSKLFPGEEYGFLVAEDGHDVYFHASSVLGGAFDKLTVGSPLSYVEEAGEKGPQASTVKLLHPHRR